MEPCHVPLPGLDVAYSHLVFIYDLLSPFPELTVSFSFEASPDSSLLNLTVASYCLQTSISRSLQTSDSSAHFSFSSDQFFFRMTTF